MTKTFGVDDVTYAVFCVFNITKDIEQDPPKIPYIDLSIIQSLRHHYDFYSQNYNEKINTEFTNVQVRNITMNSFNQNGSELLSNIEDKDIVLIDKSHDFDLNKEITLKDTFEFFPSKQESTHYDYIQTFLDETLEIYKNNSNIKEEDFKIQVDNFKIVLKTLITMKSNEKRTLMMTFFVKQLDDIIVSVENFNALSYIGTLDFIQSMRNGGKVSTPCSKKYSVNMYNREKQIVPNKYLNYTLLQQHLLDENNKKFDNNVYENNRLLTYDNVKIDMRRKYTQKNGTSKGGKQKKMQGGQQLDISRLDISVNDNNRQRMNNAIFYNIFKFMRWSFYKKNANNEDIDVVIFKDYLFTLIGCIILHSIHQNKLAIGVFIDQALSMGMYYKYRNEKVLLLPYYLPFV